MPELAPDNKVCADRLNFISTLSNEFLKTKGYGVYAYLTPMGVIRLFKRFQKLHISEKDFSRTYVKLF